MMHPSIESRRRTVAVKQAILTHIMASMDAGPLTYAEAAVAVAEVLTWIVGAQWKAEAAEPEEVTA